MKSNKDRAAIIRADSSIGRASRRCLYGFLAGLFFSCTFLFSLTWGGRPAYAANDLAPADTILRDGRTVGQLADVIKVGMNLRKEAMDRGDTGADQLENVLTLLNFDMPRKSTLQMLSFFMRGAVPFPMLAGDGADYSVFYNPIADVVLIIKWEIKKGAPEKVLGARLLSAERLLLGEPSGEEARWTMTTEMSDTVFNLTKEIQFATATATRAFSEVIENLMESAPEKVDLAIAIKRIVVSGFGTSDQVIPCGKQISEASRTTNDIKNAATSTNISGDNRLLVPVGGVVMGEYSIRVLGVKTDPGNYIFVAADNSRGCEIFAANGLHALSAPQ